MSNLHIGQFRWSRSHGSTQALWNTCLQEYTCQLNIYFMRNVKRERWQLVSEGKKRTDHWLKDNFMRRWSMTYLHGNTRTRSACLNDSIQTAQHSRKSIGTARLLHAVPLVDKLEPGKSDDFNVFIGIFSSAFFAATQRRLWEGEKQWKGKENANIYD